jgi:hypothetical protein
MKERLRGGTWGWDLGCFDFDEVRREEEVEGSLRRLGS